MLSVLPATTASRKEPSSIPKISEVVLVEGGGTQREAAKLREDEGATALKRRKVDNNYCETVNTQTSVRTADTTSDLKVSPQNFEMSQPMSEVSVTS